MSEELPLKAKKHVLRIHAIGRFPEIAITEERFVQYKGAREILSHCLSIEEKYEILLSNYLEFEKQLLDATLSHMVRGAFNYSDFFDVRLALNVRLVNLLTAAKLYSDQVKQHATECSPETQDPKAAIEMLFSAEYDKYPEFRFMEALRNFVQHRGIPVHWTSLGSRLTKLEGGLFEYSTELASLRSELEKDGKFKQEVLNHLSDRTDLKVATRRYMESIGNVHDAVRNLIASSVNASRALIESAHREYKEVYKESLIGLSACEWGDDGASESIPLMLDWDDIRIDLQKRNRKAINLHRRYVTGKIKEDDGPLT